ncbi:trypsin-like serine protease [Sandarakinorhabdus limnophila]|nr:trypsin-like serine protease [Sandarakinorhabdus limnophila]
MGARTSAQKDSGGPLTCPVGLVSTGVGCGCKGVPALYNSVAHYAE